jgi:hypothetical protein
MIYLRKNYKKKFLRFAYCSLISIYIWVVRGVKVGEGGGPIHHFIMCTHVPHLSVCVCDIPLSIDQHPTASWSGGSGQWEALVPVGVGECATLNE